MLPHRWYGLKKRRAILNDVEKSTHAILMRPAKAVASQQCISDTFKRTHIVGFHAFHHFVLGLASTIQKGLVEMIKDTAWTLDCTSPPSRQQCITKCATLINIIAYAPIPQKTYIALAGVRSFCVLAARMGRALVAGRALINVGANKISDFVPLWTNQG